MEISLQLSTFNNVKYYDKPHTYYIDGKRMTSATQFISKFKPSFDSEYWAEKKSY